MDNTRFCTDGTHNYFVVTCEDGWDGKNYQYRMLTGNRIEGILPCSVLRRGGREELYYEITSRQTLACMYRDNMISGVEIRKLLNAVIRAGSQIGEYLLDYSCIVLAPEYIYYDFLQEDYQFLYYPEESDSGSCRKLLEFIADKLDETDDALCAGIFLLCSMAENDNFILDSAALQKAFPEGEDEKDERREGQDSSCTSRESGYPESAWKDMPEEKNYRESETDREVREQKDSEETDENGKLKVKKSKTGMFSLLAFLCLAAGAVLEYCRRTVISENYQLYALSGAAAFLAAAALLAAAGIILMIRQKSGTEEDEEEEEAVQGNVKEFENDHKQTQFYVTGNYYNASVLTDPDTQYQVHKNTYRDEPLPQKAPMKLHGIGEARGYHINLEDLPCTVGKVERYVDYMIDEPSVSGMHVRFFRKGDDIFMKDLNSTNGTYLNGERLGPNGEERICRGDEIRIGALEFCYR